MLRTNSDTMIPFLVYSLRAFNFIVSIRRIKVSFPAEIRRTPLDDLAVLATGEEVRVPVELVLFPAGAAGGYC